MSHSTLHPIEKKILMFFSGKEPKIADIDTIVKGTNLSIDQIRRGIEWMKFKKLVEIVTETVTYIKLSFSKEQSHPILPERVIVKHIRDTGRESIEILELAKVIQLSPTDYNAGVAKALKNGWISLIEKSVILNKSSDQISTEEKLLQRLETEKKINASRLNQEELEAYRSLKRRPGFIEEKKETSHRIKLSEGGLAISSGAGADSSFEVSKLTSDLLRSDRWKRLRFSSLDVTALVQSRDFGRSHPLTDLISEIKEILVSMGFSEIEGSLIQSAFWNFDVLFTPQDHPARDMQDTFYVNDNLVTEQFNEAIVGKVSHFHKIGWRYDWQISQGAKHVLRTHTTPVTLKYLSDNKPSSARIFSLGQVFRNEKMTYKHLMEFHQVEGVVTGKGLSLRDLMGLQTIFYSRLGIKKVKFWPTFFPYTEPSLQSMVYIESTGKWIELFGMGILRPEVTKSIGIKGITLAWGGGLERLAMIRYGLKDVREIYENKLSWLRSVPVCQS
jgi:phenylalanyl-tRNA synthetase alpha chain